MKSKKDSSVNIQNKSLNRVHQLAEPAFKSTTSFETGRENQYSKYAIIRIPFVFIGMYNPQASYDGYQVPPGMVLVAASQQQEQSYPRVIEASHQQQSYPRVIEASHQQQSYPRVIEASHQQPHTVVSQYQPTPMVHSNSFKTNRGAHPPPAYKVQPVNNMLQNNCIEQLFFFT